MRLLFQLAFLTSAAARAASPMATEDADALVSGQCEWETVAQRQHPPTQSGWGGKLGCGGWLGGQIGLGGQRSRGDEGAFDSLALGGKVVLRPRQGQGLGLTLAWELASQGRRFDSRQVLLVATRSLGAHGLLHLNLGAVHSRLQHQTLGLWALGGEWTPLARLDLLAEVHGQQHGRPQFGLGLRFNPTPAWSLGLMGAQSGARAESRTWLASLHRAF